MPVTASTWAYDGPSQVDGSRMVIERHTCANGIGTITNVYFAPAGVDPATLIAARVAVINSGLIAAETAAAMANDAAPVVPEQGMTAFLQAMRAAYKVASKADACRLAWWLLRRIAANDITDAQCQTAFGMTAAAWTTTKTNRLTPQSNAWAALLAAVGA